jgi:transcriptional regulator with XRE-family HTH domain
MIVNSAADLVRLSRARAGLSQRALARRAGKPQSVVARIENKSASPTWATLTRLIQAAGFELQASLERPTADSSQMLDDVPRILRLSPEQRLIELRNISRFVASAKRNA